MATRYRDLQPQSLIDVGARSTPTGGANAAQALAESFSAFSRTSAAVGSLAAEFGAKKSAEAGAQAGLTGKPELRKGIASLTKYGQAYNNAALRGYAVRSELDANNTAARLEVEAGTDPERFQKTMDAARDAVLAEAPEEARSLLQEVYAKRTGEGTARIHGALATELRTEDRTLISENIAQQTERIANLRSQNTPEAFAEADEEEVKLNLLIDGAANDGTLSATEGIALRRTAKRDVLMATVLERFKNELNDPHGDPVSMLETVKDVVRQDQSLTPEEEAKLEASLFAELRDRNSLDAARESVYASEREARYAEGDRLATGQLLSGGLTQRKLLQMVEADQLSSTVARTLLNELQSGDRAPKSDSEELFHVETNLLSTSEEDIVSNRGLTWADRQRLILKRRDEASGWKSTQVAREAFDRIDRVLGIVPGTSVKMLSADELRQRDEALSDLYDLVDALPPEERQGAVLEKASQVIDARVRQSASSKLAIRQEQLSSYLKRMGDPSGFDATKKAKYDDQITRYQNSIRDLESKAAGTQ